MYERLKEEQQRTSLPEETARLEETAAALGLHPDDSLPPAREPLPDHDDFAEQVRLDRHLDDLLAMWDEHVADHHRDRIRWHRDRLREMGANE